MKRIMLCSLTVVMLLGISLLPTPRLVRATSCSVPCRNICDDEYYENLAACGDNVRCWNEASCMRSACFINCGCDGFVPECLD